jgi:hypothetical protein
MKPFASPNHPRSKLTLMQSNNKNEQNKRDMGYFERAVISNGYFERALISKTTTKV